MEDVLDQDHPSFGTQSAAFLFSIGAKLLLVEVGNPYAVATIERILIMNDQVVSSTCNVLSVFRDCGTIGVRNRVVEKISYVDFMMDVVDSNLLLDDQVALDCFGRSVTSEEREYVIARSQMLESIDSTEEVRALPATVPGNRDQLQSALVGMGFKKSAVDKFVRGLGQRADHEPITDLLREGLRACA